MCMYKRNSSTQDLDTITLEDALSQKAPKPEKVCLFLSMQLLKIKPEILWSSICIHSLYIDMKSYFKRTFIPLHCDKAPMVTIFFFVHTLMKDFFCPKCFSDNLVHKKNNEFSRKEVSTYIRAKAINEAKRWRYLKPQNIWFFV